MEVLAETPGPDADGVFLRAIRGGAPKARVGACAHLVATGGLERHRAFLAELAERWKELPALLPEHRRLIGKILGTPH